MEYENYTIGSDNELIQFDSRSENRELASRLIAQARDQIRIFTPNLENPVYDSPSISQAITNLATRNRHSQIKILVKDSIPAVKLGHRMIEVARQFTSSIHLHLIPKEYKDNETAFLTIDEDAYLYKHHGTLYQGQCNFDDKLRARDLNKLFDEIWERSHADPELRRLYI